MRRSRTSLSEARFILYALLVHVVLLGLLVVNLSQNRMVQQTEPPDIIHAVSVDEDEVMSELQSRRDAIAEQQAAEERRQREAEEAQRRAEEERARQEEARRQQEIEQRRQQEQARQQAERQRQQETEQRQREQERQRQAEQERRRQEEAERQRRAEEERRKQEEAERQRRAEEERRKQEEAERQRQEAERRRQEEQQRQAEEARREREAELQRQLEEEQAQAAAERARTRFVSAWSRAVRNAWTRPPGSATGLSADVQVRLQPNGEVISIEIVRSSGDASFDRSVENAIRRASPLSVPDDARAFQRAGLDNITFRFNPDQ